MFIHVNQPRLIQNVKIYFKLINASPVRLNFKPLTTIKEQWLIAHKFNVGKRLIFTNSI
jgi:hypothetical protein